MIYQASSRYTPSYAINRLLSHAEKMAQRIINAPGSVTPSSDAANSTWIARMTRNKVPEVYRSNQNKKNPTEKCNQLPSLWWHPNQP